MKTPLPANLITAAVDLVGRSMIARACYCSRQAVVKWERAGRLPRTELTGETNYAQRIARLTNRKIKRSQLIEWTAKAWANNAREAE